MLAHNFLFDLVREGRLVIAVAGDELFEFLNGLGAFRFAAVFFDPRQFALQPTHQRFEILMQRRCWWAMSSHHCFGHTIILPH